MATSSDNTCEVSLSPEIIRKALKTKWLGQQAIYSFNVVESTNTEASTLARNGAAEGTVVLAETQIRGRGRLGRSWISPPGAGLYFSVILRPESPSQWASLLTLTAGVAVVVAIRQAGISAELKWPNDIMIGNRKAGGILTEAIFREKSVSTAIVGIGINVNTGTEDFPPSIRGRATSIYISSGKLISRVALFQALLYQLEQWYELFQKGAHEMILKVWREYDTTLGNLVEVCLPESTVSGVAEDVNSIGQLLVRDQTGRLHTIIAGDVVHCHHLGGNK